jgi:hypothetical protein
MLGIVSVKAPIPKDYRWPFLISAILLSAPGVIVMLLTVPFREEDIEEAEKEWPEADCPQAGPGTLAPTVALPSPAERHPSLVYGHCPDFGDYIYSPTTTSWTQRRAMSNGQSLLLRGRGRSPSAEQVALWQAIDLRLDKLTEMAMKAVDPPPLEAQRTLFSNTPVFSRAALVLQEVRLEQCGSQFYFNHPLGKKIHLWPVVSFADWRVTGSEWVS